MAQRAPGRSDREGMSFINLMRMFPDDATAEAWFENVRWKGNPHCPHCGSLNVLTGAAHKTMPYRCREKECRKRFSVRTGTFMEASNIGYQKWAIAFYLFATNIKGVSSMKLHRDLGITQKSAWFMAHRIREGWIGRNKAFIGPVEIDETYVGGKRRNMHYKRKQRFKGTGGVGKTIVVGARDRSTNNIVAHTVPHNDTRTLVNFATFYSKRKARVFTDMASAYERLPNRHQAVNHNKGEYVRGAVHTNGIEAFWALFKRGLYGTYHSVSPQHLDRYLTEFSGRHNLRSLDTIEQMREMVRRGVGRRLTYKALTA